MVFLRHLLDRRTTAFLFICLTLGILIAEVKSTKIAYKKSINGKTQLNKVKPIKFKTIKDESNTTTTTPQPLSEIVLKTTSTTTPSVLENMDVAESAHSVRTIKNSEEQQEIALEENDEPKAMEQLVQMEAILDATDANSEGHSTVSTISKEIVEENTEETIAEIPENHIDEEHVVDETPITEHLPNGNTVDPIEEPTNSNEHSANTTTESTDVQTTTPSKQPTPCTCGIFMTSQIKRSKNPYEPPTGKPVITNELDRTFPCNAVGQKQCQTKCLEAIVQHLPNSANILCATLDRDIRKERAYLYIKNCRNQWFNTNLAAGREYCCKNGQPYQCPLV